MVNETNPIPEGYHEAVSSQITLSVSWNDPRLVHVVRLRLITDPGLPFWDVSYCHGRLEDGTYCHVELPFDQLPRRGFRRAIVHYAIKDGVYAKKLGILVNISTLV